MYVLLLIALLAMCGAAVPVFGQAVAIGLIVGMALVDMYAKMVADRLANIKSDSYELATEIKGLITYYNFDDKLENMRSSVKAFVASSLHRVESIKTSLKLFVTQDGANTHPANVAVKALLNHEERMHAEANAALDKGREPRLEEMNAPAEHLNSFDRWTKTNGFQFCNDQIDDMVSQNQ